MLHLFNSCYVFPDVLFNSSQNYVVVGKNYLSYGSNVENSFFHSSVNVKECLGKFETYEEFIITDLFKNIIGSNTTTNIYVDDENFIKFYTALLKTHIKNLTQELFLDLVKIESIRINKKNKLVPLLDLSSWSNSLYNLTDIPNVSPFDLSNEWIVNNAGIEWKLINGKTDTLSNLIDRFIYSYFTEAKAIFLSRKSAENSWALDTNNQQYDTVLSIKDLYMEMRKEICVNTDSIILDYLNSTNLSEFIKDPKFLVLLSSNGNLENKVDIWLLRWLMKLNTTQIQNLGLVS
jgi:hypothetical protein